MTIADDAVAQGAPDQGARLGLLGHQLDRRRFLTYLVAGPTLAIAVSQAPAGPAQAVIPGTPEVADLLDLGDFLILAAKPTESILIELVAEPDGTISCDLPREEVGQGILTATTMIIAQELGLPLDRVRVTNSDPRPELLTGQVTGGSNTIRSIYQPIIAATAAMRGSFAAAAAAMLNVPISALSFVNGAVVADDGRSLSFGELAAPAADPTLERPDEAPAAPEDARHVGVPTNRLDALGFVTGTHQYTQDIDVPGAKPTMVRRPDTLRGSVKTIRNLAAVRAMPGILAVEVVDLSRNIASPVTGPAAFSGGEDGIAVVGETFGQVLDAKEALDVVWNRGPIGPQNDEEVFALLRGLQPPFGAPDLSVLDPLLDPVGGLLGGSSDVVAKTEDGEFDFHFIPHAPLEANTAIADFKDGRCEVWAGMKTPIIAQQTVAAALGIATDDVTMHCLQSGGSFGRRLFFDSPVEAAKISQKVGMPVKLLWPRVDDMRHGRARPAFNHRLRFTYAEVAGQTEVVSFEQGIAGFETDFRHGLGESLTALSAQVNPPALPVSIAGNASFSQTVFLTTVESPYEFGATKQVLVESAEPFNTGSWRSVFTVSARGCEELMINRLAKRLGRDPADFRLEFMKEDRQRRVLQRVMADGEYGRALPAGFAQGIAFHEEYKSVTACLVEVDGRDPQRPRVTRATMAVDAGLPINPRGLDAQLQGGLTDAIATVFRGGLHLRDGLFLEGSYSQFHFPRLKDSPLDLQVHVFPATPGAEPGGAGELGVPAAFGAIASAYENITRTPITSFPVIFPVDFTPLPKGAGTTRVRVPAPQK